MILVRLPPTFRILFSLLNKQTLAQLAVTLDQLKEIGHFLGYSVQNGCSSTSSEAAMRFHLSRSHTARLRLQNGSSGNFKIDLLFGVPGWSMHQVSVNFAVDATLVSNQSGFAATFMKQYPACGLLQEDPIERVYVDGAGLRTGAAPTSLPCVVIPQHDNVSPFGSTFCTLDWDQDQESHTRFSVSLESGLQRLPPSESFESIFNSSNAPYPWFHRSIQRINEYSRGADPLYVTVRHRTGKSDMPLVVSATSMASSMVIHNATPLELPATHLESPHAKWSFGLGDSHLTVAHQNDDGVDYAFAVYDLFADRSVALNSRGALRPKYTYNIDVDKYGGGAADHLFSCGHLLVSHGKSLLAVDMRSCDPYADGAASAAPILLAGPSNFGQIQACGRLVALLHYNRGLEIFDLLQRRLITRFPKCSSMSFLDSTNILLSAHGGLYHVDLVAPRTMFPFKPPTLELGLLSGPCETGKNRGRASRARLQAVEACSMESSICEFLNAESFSDVHCIKIREEEYVGIGKFGSLVDFALNLSGTRRWGRKLLIFFRGSRVKSFGEAKVFFVANDGANGSERATRPVDANEILATSSIRELLKSFSSDTLSMLKLPDALHKIDIRNLEAGSWQPPLADECAALFEEEGAYDFPVSFVVCRMSRGVITTIESTQVAGVSTNLELILSHVN